jgi:hypothetical protein
MNDQEIRKTYRRAINRKACSGWFWFPILSVLALAVTLRFGFEGFLLLGCGAGIILMIYAGFVFCQDRWHR